MDWDYLDEISNNSKKTFRNLIVIECRFLRPALQNVCLTLLKVSSHCPHAYLDLYHEAIDHTSMVSFKLQYVAYSWSLFPVVCFCSL